ncbi:MAG: polymer-forming cytoskeletal protein [Lachnospiraceae bacterium]|nr:polymer-forming cytoskeletal protein [Lachnospiraceae bacterium]
MKKSRFSSRKIKYCLRDQSGSTLITVIATVSFMVVLATIMMATSFGNLHMKQIEYHAKRTFYADEKGLNDVYNGLGRDISECLSKSYNDTLAQVTAQDGSAQYASQSKAYEQFAALFAIRMESLFGTDGEHRDATRDKLKAYVAGSGTDKAEVLDYASTKLEKTAEGHLSRYIFKDVQIKYTDSAGAGAGNFETLITTDIVVEVPYINFFQDFSRVLDYSLIGNQGVYFKNADCLVEGNVYAGTSTKAENASYQGYQYSVGTVYDGMNFYQSNVTFANNSYIISKGDMNVCESAVEVQGVPGKQASVGIWAENIRTVENTKAGSMVGIKDEPSTESKLTADANIYVADDLELNARKSKVTLAGNYYGYNYNLIQSGVNKAYHTEEKDNIQNLYNGSSSKASHASSSAIMLNANKSTLDLTGLDTLIVAGLAYMDIKDPDASYSQVAASGKLASEYQTGESLALRYNQALYLAPDEILTCNNPVKNGSLDVNAVCPPEGDSASKLADWFGSTYLLGSAPIKAVEYEYSGVKYVYYFLNFRSEADKAAYVEEVLTAPAAGSSDPAFAKQKYKLKQEILGKADKTGIVSNIAIDGSGCKVYTKGVITNTAAGSVKDNTITKPAIYKESLRMANHYVYLYKRLDPAEKYGIVESGLSVDDLNTDIAVRGLAEEDLPLAYFVDMDNIVTDESNTVKGYQVLVKTVNGGSVPVINSDVKGIIISKGDIVINASVEGIVIAGGKITVTTNGSVKSNRGIIQTILESEQRDLSGIKEAQVDQALLRKYASYYFKQSLVDDTLVSESNHKYIDSSQRVTSTKYTDFMYYENWHKGAPMP